MGRHSKDVAARSYRGRHRAPTHTGKVVARVATTGTLAVAPLGMIGAPALAAESQVVPVASVSAASGFDHDVIAQCESGGDARADNPSPNSSASGLYQFIDSTWKAYGGSTARAKDASVSEQRRVAERAFAAEGYSPWNASKSCWSGKLGSGSKVSSSHGESATSSKSGTKSGTKSSTKSSTKSVTKSQTKSRQSHAKKHAGKSSGTHRVVAGETLSEITTKLTGSHDWSKMYDANKSVIGENPNLIIPGQVLKVVK